MLVSEIQAIEMESIRFDDLRGAYLNIEVH